MRGAGAAHGQRGRCMPGRARSRRRAGARRNGPRRHGTPHAPSVTPLRAALRSMSSKSCCWRSCSRRTASAASASASACACSTPRRPAQRATPAQQVVGHAKRAQGGHTQARAHVPRRPPASHGPPAAGATRAPAWAPLRSARACRRWMGGAWQTLGAACSPHWAESPARALRSECARGRESVQEAVSACLPCLALRWAHTLPAVPPRPNPPVTSSLRLWLRIASASSLCAASAAPISRVWCAAVL